MSLLMARFQSAVRTVALVAAIAVGFLLVFYFFSFKSSPSFSSLSISKNDEKSHARFHVKVIPADLSDDAIDNLPKESFNYLAMIDAGSSGCRAHVYRYGKLGSEDGPLYIVPKHNSMKIKPGLSTFAEKTAEAGPSLAGLINFLKTEIPEVEWTSTPIWLKATAGLRMLDSERSAAILLSVRVFLLDKTKSPFLFRPSWAKVITGNEEGAFGWVAVNYLYKMIGPKKQAAQDPYAVVEMGGASTQVTQIAPSKKVAATIPNQNKFSFNIGQENYVLYTHSYLGYGGEQAREAVNKALTNYPQEAVPVATTPTSAATSKQLALKDPCLNQGFVRPKEQPRKDYYEGPAEKSLDVVGAADGLVNSCLEFTRTALFSYDQKACKSPPPHSFNCVHQPDFLKTSKNFLVFEVQSRTVRHYLTFT